MSRRVLVIKGSEWDRTIVKDGNIVHCSNGWLHYSGRYCCLGLDARACGFSEEQMHVYGTPASLFYELKNNDVQPTEAQRSYFDNWMAPEGNNNKACQRAMHINDDMYDKNDRDYTDESKIEALRPIFADKGIDIEWRPDE